MKKDFIRLDKITPTQANDLAYKVLKDYFTRQSIAFGNIHINYEISRGLFVNDKLVGIYLLVPKCDPENRLIGKGIEGVCLAVLKKYQGKGYGRMLIEYSESLPFDYIHGGHDKRLNNIAFWLKRRELYSEDSRSFHTYKYLNNINNLHLK